MRFAPMIVICAGLMAGPLSAKIPLSQVTVIDDALMAVAIADQIRKRCDNIDARLARAWLTLNDLKQKARNLGYSDPEIEDYVTSKSEKARMRAKAERWLSDQGVAASDKAALCRFGTAEIKRNSAIGRLLR